MNQPNPTHTDLTSVGVPYKQSFVIDIRRYQGATDIYESMLLHRTGFPVEVIFLMAFRLFSMFSPPRNRGEAPPMIPQASLSTITDSVQPFRDRIKTAHECAIAASSCNLSFDNFKRMVNDNVIRMYVVIYASLVNMYTGLMSHYQVDGLILETTAVDCQCDRIYFGVFNVL